ncbi:MAG: ATP-binding cassette domain-containing protein [Opitutaceae bacterium]|jgi:phospholipid/cholesterol/gamma-HCH transport system ATP-binding protein|nr:ATP-binding cassette domain-containing protein [Opitutaceae bacterium]
MATSRKSPIQRQDRSPAAVKVEGLSKSYGSQEVLHDVSFNVEPGEIFVIMGPSGSGKSVLLRHIAGLEVPTRGKLDINGFNPTLPETRDQFALALVFQSGALLNSLSVYDNLALYPHEHRLCPQKDLRDRVMRALRILSIEHAVQKMPAELSGGMRKRVAIARALVMEPQLLLYDEPTSELDPIMAATIAEIIATLREEYAVTSIVVSHDRDLSLTIADRFALMQGGQLHSVAPPGEFQKSTDPIITEFLNPQINLQNPRFKSLETSS